jgi:TonB-linked SusC/RagA family outer membrane protein
VKGGWPFRWLLACLCLFGLAVQTASAQQKAREIKGAVIDKEGVPVEGASVTLKGTQTGTITIKDGLFAIRIPDTLKNPILIISILNYISKEVPIGKDAMYNITLEKQNNSMDEVVVIGYGTVSKKDATGSVARVNVEELRKAPALTIDQALAGRVSGVQVISADGEPGANAEIIVRGVGSVTQSSAPLYVIDGFPQEDANFNAINPADIESIEVLKDASSTAIYGARGSNGVVLITTKRGKSAKPVLSYNGYSGFQTPTKLMKLLDAYEFVRLQNDANPIFANAVYFTNGKTLEDYRNVKTIDWQDIMFVDNPSFQNHNISLSARSQKTAYTISASYGNQQGLIINSGFKRYQARITLDQEVNDKLKVGINVNYANTKAWGQTPSSQNTPINTSANNANFNFMTTLWSYRPVMGAKADPNDVSFIYEDLLDNNIDEGGVPGNGRVNPYVQAMNQVNDRLNSTINANAYLTYKIARNLSLRSNVGVNLLRGDNYTFNNSMTNSGSPLTSSGQTFGINGSTSTSRSYSFLNENTINYNKSFNKRHRLDAVVGFTWQKWNNESYGYSVTNLPNESLGFRGLGQGTPRAVSSGSSLSSMASFLGRVNYTYRDNYLFTLSMRADGTSKFHPDNRWGYFPSGAVAWRFSNESFMKDLTFLTEGKLRLSHGLTGNNRVSDFAYKSLLTANTSTLSGSYYSINNQIMYNIVINTMANANLKWESGQQTDVGLELSFLNNRISTELEYYNRTTNDLLLNASMPHSTGFTSAFMNIGKVRNYGFELTLNTINIQGKRFNWNTSFNISFNRNMLMGLNSGEDAMLTIRSFDASVGSVTNYIAKVGQPIAQFYGLISDGMYQLSDFYLVPDGTNGFAYVLKEGVPYYNFGRNPNNLGDPNLNPAGGVAQPGSPKFVDINGDGMINANDYTVIGNPYPKHYGGLINNFSYKGFDLNIFLQWSYGNQILNANRMRFEGSTSGNGFPTAVNGGYINQNMFATFANRWTPENPSNVYPSMNATTEALRQYSTRIIEDGSYLRVKTVQLGYNLPQSWLKRAKIANVRCYISAQNLLTFTKYTGPDPEVNVGGSNLAPGFDFSPYPRTKVYTAGLNLSL